MSAFYSNPVLNEGSSAAHPFASFTQVLGPIADYLWDAERYAASTSSEDASWARWQALLAASVARIEACKPCGAAAPSFHCVDAKTIGYCDPVTKCFTTVTCGGGCSEGSPAQCTP